MYVKTWEEFERAAKNLYIQDPKKARFVMKYTHCQSTLNIKLTDDATCLQYKTEIVQDFKKIEKFVANLMRHMASKE